MVKYKTTEHVLNIMDKLDNVRNIGTLAHVDHGKTTLSDSLLMAAGLISPKVAGKALALDYVPIEQMRQMTVKAANVSLYHEYNGEAYLINLVDTPGHVDFTGHVTRSLRVMDGAIVVVDAVEGVMTQTETVVRQALEERVRPLLYVNKIDRLIRELKLTPEEIQQRLLDIIKDFNNLIELYAEPEFKDTWRINPLKGQMAFGSALHKWGLTIPIAQKVGAKFSEIIKAYEKGVEEVAHLADEFPLYRAILDMVVQHVPSPRVAQKYRIPKIWRGDIDSEIGQAMLKCDPKGPLVICASKIVVDPHAGLVTTGRIFSGISKSGDEVYLMMAKRSSRIQQVGLYMGPYREVVDRILAGNIVALLGLDDARAGETIISIGCKGLMTPFEKLMYISEPVVTVSIEPRKSADLPRLVDTLRKMAIEDPTLHVKINEETGEYLISGMGTLHLEIALWDLQQRTGGIDVEVSPPIVVYRESIRGSAGPIEGKSPNRHNRIYISIEPLDETTLKLLSSGAVYEDQDWRTRAKILRSEAGWDSDEARGIIAIDQHLSIFVDVTKGVQYLRDIKETLISAFRWAMEAGPLAQEPIRGVKVKLIDAMIHEDPAHRGPAQIMPATKNAIFAAFLSASPVLLEPILKMDAKVPQEFLSGLLRVITSKRGKILNMEQQKMLMFVKCNIPVSETFDLSDQIRGTTQGRCFWSTEFSHWNPVPQQLAEELIKQIRKRKGLPPNVPKAEDFIIP
ncbi:MAG: elongation factor EF-2 [Candidatus Methanomethylicia archaeon]|nr:elongation factor EF-2 [Candidatus Methanomethylicia archaeon]MCX8169020.1 elongation factor EF-2 [Candidatus Methanomethylicia archaeon]MDW7988752.1 elongation factor EF-2 [Nitrososphaerota archaeon]